MRTVLDEAAVARIDAARARALDDLERGIKADPPMSRADLERAGLPLRDASLGLLAALRVEVIEARAA